MATRIFKRLNFQPNGGQIHPFFLDHMAYQQITRNGNFISGPMMYSQEANDEYTYWSILQQLEYGMRYFMRPYTFVAFGHNERDITKNSILTRTWLQHINGENTVIATVERIDIHDISKYMTSLNYHTIWKSTFTDCTNASSIKQTVLKTDNPYKGWYNTVIELK